MFELLVEGGLYFTIPLTVLAVLASVLIVWEVSALVRGQSGSTGFRKRLDLLLQVGLLSFIIGILAQALGLYQMLKAIEGIGAVSPALVAGGLAVSAIAPIFGLIILTASYVTWLTIGNGRRMGGWDVRTMGR